MTHLLAQYSAFDKVKKMFLPARANMQRGEGKNEI
jgi:hypothetical protein